MQLSGASNEIDFAFFKIQNKTRLLFVQKERSPFSVAEYDRLVITLYLSIDLIVLFFLKG